LIESAHPMRAPRSRINKTLGSTGGLPGSFSNLRPASLPVPSRVLPPRAHHGVDSSSQSVRTPQVVPHHTRQSTRIEPEIQGGPESLDPREAEILKLVAADTPSHRGAWGRDSKAWQLFVRRHERAGRSSAIPEEFEDNDDPAFGIRDGQDDSEDDYDTELDAQNGANHMSIVGSLPIDINPLLRPKSILSLASYQPEAPISDHSEIVSPRISSTATFRKAAYAERDRTRSMDPGTLDFDVEAGTDDDDTGKPTTVDTGERGRKLALKILQARSSLPAPGMWRSLA